MLVIDRTVTAVKPTLNDHDVLEFCKNGFLALKGVIPQSTNDWVFEQLDRDDGHETDLADSERFVNEVFLNPAVTGVIRSVLGDNFLFPEQVHNHRLAGPKKPLPWHIDAGARFDRTCDLVYAFYVPQTNTKEGGATYFLPGSHLVPITREELQHFGHLAGQVQTVAPAGSVFIVHSSIWHRQALKTDPGTRNLVRWSYWRSEPPRRDWIVDPEFDIGTADFAIDSEYFTTATRRWQSVPRVAEMFMWLCGKSDHFRWLGGNGWPYNHSPSSLLDREGWKNNGG